MFHKQWIDLIPFYITGTLSQTETDSIEQHLQTCQACHQVLLEWTEIANIVHNVANEKSQLLPPLSQKVRESVLSGQPNASPISLNGKIKPVPTEIGTSRELESRSIKIEPRRINIPITLVAVGLLVLVFIGVLIATIPRDSKSPDEIAFLAPNDLTNTASPTITVTSRGIEDIGIITPLAQSPLETRIYSTLVARTEVSGVGGGGADFGTDNLNDLCHIDTVESAIVVYSFPETTADIVGSIDSGELWRVITRSGDGWYNIIDELTGERGWMLSTGGVFTGICDDIPLPTPTINAITSPYEQCLVSSNNEDEPLQIYSLPSYESTGLYVMPAQTTAVVLGYSADEQWYQIRYTQAGDSWQGWVNIHNTIQYFTCDNLSVVEADSTLPIITPTPTLLIATPSLSTPHPQIIAFATSDDNVSAGQAVTISWAVQDTSAIWLEYYDPENDPSINSAYIALGLYSDLPRNGAIDVIVPQNYAYDTIYFNLILGTNDRSGRNAGEIIAVTVIPNDD